MFGAIGTDRAVQQKGPCFITATARVNTQPLTPDGLREKVVLIDFSRSPCVNWIHTLPYMRAFAFRYRKQGLVVIGVRTGDFSCEKKSENVNTVIRQMNIGFPVVMDKN
jgi:hypothetical protein